MGLGALPRIARASNACGSLPPPRAGTWPRPPCGSTASRSRANWPTGSTSIPIAAATLPAKRSTFAAAPGMPTATASSIEPGKKLTVEVLGDGDRRLRRQEVTLSAAGTFAFDFLLPAEMPEGAYKVLVHDQAGHRQAVDFQDRPAGRRPLRLVLDLPKIGLLSRRDDRRHAARRAAAGPPFGRREGDVQTGQRARDHRDDRRPRRGPFRDPHGRIGVLRPTWHSRRPSRRDRLSLRRNVTVATRGFSIGLETNRPVFVAGETFDVRVTTTRRRRSAKRGKTASEGLPARASSARQPARNWSRSIRLPRPPTARPANAQAGQRRRVRRPCDGNRSLRQYDRRRVAS